MRPWGWSLKEVSASQPRFLRFRPQILCADLLGGSRRICVQFTKRFEVQKSSTFTMQIPYVRYECQLILYKGSSGHVDVRLKIDKIDVFFVVASIVPSTDMHMLILNRYTFAFT